MTDTVQRYLFLFSYWRLHVVANISCAFLFEFHVTFSTFPKHRNRKVSGKVNYNAGRTWDSRFYFALKGPALLTPKIVERKSQFSLKIFLTVIANDFNIRKSMFLQWTYMLASIMCFRQMRMNMCSMYVHLRSRCSECIWTNKLS